MALCHHFTFPGGLLAFSLYYIDLFSIALPFISDTGSADPILASDASLSYLSLVAFHGVPEVETWPQFPPLLLCTWVAAPSFQAPRPEALGPLDPCPSVSPQISIVPSPVASASIWVE